MYKEINQNSLSLAIRLFLQAVQNNISTFGLSFRFQNSQVLSSIQKKKQF